MFAEPVGNTDPVEHAELLEDALFAVFVRVWIYTEFTDNGLVGLLLINQAADIALILIESLPMFAGGLGHKRKFSGQREKSTKKRASLRPFAEALAWFVAGSFSRSLIWFLWVFFEPRLITQICGRAAPSLRLGIEPAPPAEIILRTSLRIRSRKS